MAQSVKYLPSAQVVVIPGSWNTAPHRDPCSEGSLLLPLPSVHALSRSLSQIIKSFFKKKRLVSRIYNKELLQLNIKSNNPIFKYGQKI